MIDNMSRIQIWIQRVSKNKKVYNYWKYIIVYKNFDLLLFLFDLSFVWLQEWIVMAIWFPVRIMCLNSYLHALTSVILIVWICQLGIELLFSSLWTLVLCGSFVFLQSQKMLDRFLGRIWSGVKSAYNNCLVRVMSHFFHLCKIKNLNIVLKSNIDIIW